MKKFLEKDDLIVQVVYGLVGGTVLALAAFLIHALIFAHTKSAEAQVLIYVMAPIFGSVCLYIGSVWMAVAVARPGSKWAEKGFELSPTDGDPLAIIIFGCLFYFPLAIIITIILRAVGVNGYAGHAYSPIIFDKNKIKKPESKKT